MSRPENNMCGQSLVSVVIPCYNAAEFIGNAIESVLQQSYINIEVIVIDDGSTDESADIVRKFVEGDRRVRLIYKGNGGLASARNCGIDMARGQYLAFLDCDDVWHRDKLWKHLAHFRENSTQCPASEGSLLGVSYSATRFIDVKGNALHHSRHPRTKELDEYYLYCRNPITNGSNAVFDRRVFSSVRFDEALSRNQDVDCWLRIAFGSDRRWRFEGIDEELTYYRVNESGLSADYSSHYECCRRTWKKSFSYAPEIARKYAVIAEAFQLRFYARRCIGAGDFSLARRYARLALRKDPRILLKEPMSTLCTMLAAFFHVRRAG